MAQSLTAPGLAWLLPRAVWKGATGWFTTKITNYFIAGRSCRERARAGHGETRSAPTGTGGSGGGEAGRGAPALGANVFPKLLSPSWRRRVPFFLAPYPWWCPVPPALHHVSKVGEAPCGAGGLQQPLTPPWAWCLHPTALPQLGTGDALVPARGFLWEREVVQGPGLPFPGNSMGQSPGPPLQRPALLTHCLAPTPARWVPQDAAPHRHPLKRALLHLPEATR